MSTDQGPHREDHDDGRTAHYEPRAVLEQHLASASPDLAREMIATFANAMTSAQVDHVCGADYAERTNRRNGYRAREWDTRAGTVELAIPKLQEGSS